MKTQQWLQVDSLFQSAIERDSWDRTAFLNEACRGDDSLRKEVQSLIAAYDQATISIEAPVFDVAAEMIADERARLVGKHIAHYEVIARIGSGGMGEVYLAQDTRLGRQVALKLLRTELTRDASRVHRFQQEARAASALNHPNILTVHEIGQEGALYFIATEFIEGETLRQRLSRARMSLDEALDLALQIAGALQAAHQAGIVHRDVKPENIMLRPDGYVKVLDFGIAKLTERPLSTAQSTPTLVEVATEPGVVMGTVRYMSPEQARGLPVDERTDIFSLGTVLYEMTEGRTPFDGPTTGDVIVALLQNDPPPLTHCWSGAPGELHLLISRLLAKDRDQRYQTAGEVIGDLKKVRRAVASEAESEHGEVPTASSGTERPSENRRKTESGADRRTNQSIASGIGNVFARTRANLARTAGGLLLVSAVLYLISLGVGSSSVDSLAILPFINESADPNAEYLSDGITESIINSLSRIPKVRVLARSTVFRFKGTQLDPQAVGNQLKVDAVLIGRILVQGDNLTISTELVDVARGTQLWGEQYRRKAAGIIAIQEDISREISQNLRSKLTPEEHVRLTKHHTESAEALDLYFRGRHHLNNLNEEGFKKAIACFKQAIDIDPNYALAWTGLSDAYYWISNLYLPPKEAMPKSRAAAIRALEIDDTLGEAHASLAVIKSQYEWDWVGAEQEYKRAIELNSGYAEVHHMYGLYLVATGRTEEALQQLRQAQELDPLSMSIAVTAIWPYYYTPAPARHYHGAIEELRKIVALNPDFHPAHSMLAKVYDQNGMHDEAIAELNRARQLDKSTEILALLSHAYGTAGKRREALNILGELQQRSKQEHVGAFTMALAHCGLGEKDQAFASLQRAYDARDEGMVLLNVEPMFDNLRSDARFAELVRRMGL